MNSRSILAERVNSEPLLTSEELFDLFARVQQHVDECMRVLAATCPSLPLTILELGSEVVAKLQRNRSLFRRQVEYSNDVLKDATVKPAADYDQFVCDCFDLGRDLALGRDTSNRCEDVRLSRMITERFIRAWCVQASEYPSQVWSVVESFNPDNIYTESYVEAASRVVHTQYTAGLPDDIAYGLVNYIKEKVTAIDAVYAKVTQAYARVILKIAKSNAIDDDHFLELFQWGFFGLARANAIYDYVLQAKYVAVARWWARQAILFNMKASSGVIKISPSLWQHRSRMEAARYKIAARQGDVTYADIAAEMDMTETYVESVYSHIRTAQVGVFDPAAHDNDYTESPLESLTHDAVESLMKLQNPEKTYVALLYGLPEIVHQTLPEEDIRLHRLRQEIATRMIVEA